MNTNNRVQLDSSIYTQLSDITIRLKDNSTTQIDHIILSRFGIFVIETKNMKGWIFGSEFQKQWTQIIYGKKSTFQNQRHIKGLEEFLGIDRGLYSIVTFVGESTFKTTMPKNVFYGGRYISYIESFSVRVFSNEKLSKMIDTLKNESLVKSRATNREHIDSLRNSRNLYKRDTKIICKRCNSVMVERCNKISKQIFLGCSSYPRCKHTETL